MTEEYIKQVRIIRFSDYRKILRMNGDRTTPSNCSDEYCIRCLFCCIFVPFAERVDRTSPPSIPSLSTKSDSTKDTNKEGTTRTFAQSNSMFQRLGVSLERDQLELSRIMRAPSCDVSQGTDDHIALNGERHLARLQASCEYHLMRQKDGQQSSTISSGITDNCSVDTNPSKNNHACSSSREKDPSPSSSRDVPMMLGSPMSAHPSKEWEEEFPMSTPLDDITASTISNLHNEDEKEHLMNVTMAYSEGNFPIHCSIQPLNSHSLTPLIILLNTA